MSTFDTLLTVVVTILAVFRMVAAALTNDEIKEIKHVVWAIALVLILVGQMVKYGW